MRRDPRDPTDQEYLDTPPTDPNMNEMLDLLPETQEALKKALDPLEKIGEDRRWFVTQGIGGDPLSAGYHRPDGRYRAPKPGEKPGMGNYSAAVDVSLRGLVRKSPNNLSQADRQRFIRMLRALRNAGFAAWFRQLYNRDTNKWETEIHAIDPIAPFIKSQLIAQMRDYLNGRDGLVGHGRTDAAGPIVPNREAFRARARLRDRVKEKEGYRFTPYGDARPFPLP